MHQNAFGGRAPHVGPITLGEFTALLQARSPSWIKGGGERRVEKERCEGRGEERGGKGRTR